MDDSWKEEERDAASGRTIYARNVPRDLHGNYGTYDFAMAREFQVRSPDGDVLLQQSGSAKGEYWCGVFLFFVDGSEGTRVRLEESDRPEDQFFNVPEKPMPVDKIRD
ncbi:MAG: hypothetical protein AAF393_01500 [Pseudomonadota bacterium]